MKNLFWAFCIAFLVSSCGGSSDEKTKPSSKKNHVFVFFDKTESVNVDNEFVKNKYVSALNKLLETEIQNEGDRLEVYYIHENTPKAKCLEMVCRSKKPDTDGMNETDLQAAQTGYDLLIKRERRLMFDQAFKKMMEKNTNSSNAETNISGSIPVLAKAVENDENVSAYYFSDMMESLKAGRDFHKMAPISVEEAEKWATADAEKNKLYSLANVKITLILPYDAMSSSKTNNPNVGDYWKKYFDILGASTIDEL